MSGGRLPDGKSTKSNKVYVEAWRELSQALGEVVGGVPYGYDPDIGIVFPDGTTESFSVRSAEKILGRGKDLALYQSAFKTAVGSLALALGMSSAWEEEHRAILLDVAGLAPPPSLDEAMHNGDPERRCQCCGERSGDTTMGTSYCGECDGGNCKGKHND